jgi:hypothetical protein
MFNKYVIEDRKCKYCLEFVNILHYFKEVEMLKKYPYGFCNKYNLGKCVKDNSIKDNKIKE